MNLLEIVRRVPKPEPWAEGENIPWNDPGFSERMLKEHLSQVHDAASRRREIIEDQVEWIHRQVLHGRPSKILDLACGPGLYTSRFEKLGHTVRGIDFAPASVEHANSISSAEHVLADVRQADFGTGNDLVMMIFGEFNAFRRSDAVSILARARDSLSGHGEILLEPHEPEAIMDRGHQPVSWTAREYGLFSERPHILLEESFWDTTQRAATTRYWVVDAETGSVERHAQSMQHYTIPEYRQLLVDAGLKLDYIAPSLDGSATQGEFFVLVASRA
jgi:SAM-dependent methyltransferase